MVTNTASLGSLSEHFPEGTKIGMERFRPNIVLEGLEPWEEDTIAVAKIGDVILEFLIPCARCKVTTIDQFNGVSENNQPLETLVRTRRGKGDGLQGVFFGHNAVPRTTGVISRGDTVEILFRKALHPSVANTTLKPKVS